MDLVKENHLLLVLPYLGILSLQTRTKLQQALKSVLYCCKLEIAFKFQTKLFNSFRYKDPIKTLCCLVVNPSLFFKRTHCNILLIALNYKQSANE